MTLNTIHSFACKDTQLLFQGRCPRRFKAIQTQAEPKLQMLDVATDIINNLRSPLGNRLEKLSGDRKHQWSIRINQK